MTKPLKETFTFVSPINIESSMFGLKLVAKKTKSTMTVSISSNGNGNCIWDMEELELYEEIGLWFNDNTLIDYDGVMDFPEELYTFLVRKGYDLTEIKESHNY
jgi:hypothetical protein